MSREVSAAGSTDREREERARHELVEFLNDARPAMLVADSLEFLLRTDPPTAVDAEEVVELVAAWADERAAVTHEAVSVLYLSALRHVLDAHAEVRLEGFEPAAFVASVGIGLTRHCPSSELNGFQSALYGLVAPARRPETSIPSNGGESAVVRGVQMSLRDAQEAAVARLEHEAYMSDADFEDAFRDLRAALVSRVGANINGILARVARSAARIFNTGRVRQAAVLLDYVRESFDRLAIAPEGRMEATFAIGSSDLNEGLLAKALNDPIQRESAVAVVRFVGYLSPTEALTSLATENRRERRRLLLAAVEAYGSGAVNVVLDHLTNPAPGGLRWYATRNFLYLLSRIDPPDDATRRRAVEACGRYATHDQPQLRAAALAALRRIGGREVVPFVVRALDPTAYAPGSIDDADALRRHLYTALETIVETGNEAAITVAAEIAVGARGAEFDLGPSLRDEACAALMHHRGPLPRRAALVIANYLLGVCGRRFKLVTGRLAFGLDAHACRMLSALIRSSPEPECREALENPVLVKVLARSEADAL
jgi:hypothetical protein